MRLLICFIFVLSLYGCNDKTKKYIDTDFEETVLLGITPVVIDEMLFVGDFFVSDSLLVVKNSGTDSMFRIYEINTFKNIKSWGTKGRSSSEYMMPRIVKSSEGSFVIFDNSSGKITDVDLKNFSVKNNLEIKISDAPLNLCYAGNGAFLYDRKRPGNLSIFIIKPGSTPTLVYDFKDYSSKYENSNVYAGFMATNPGESKFVYAYQYIGAFDIIDFDGNLIKRIQRSASAPPILNSNSIDYENSKTYYFGAKATSDRIYLYYVGYSGARLRDNIILDTFIEEFDWDGNPKNRYKIPRFIFNFDIVSKDAFIGLDNYSDKTPFVMLKQCKFI